MVAVFRANVISAGDMSGVMTATEIIRPDQMIERLDERKPNPMRRFDVDVGNVEKDHEEARTRVLGHGERLAHSVGLDPGVLRRDRVDCHVFELFDLLRGIPFEDLKVVLFKIEHGLAVMGGKRIDANVVSLGMERGRFTNGGLRGDHDQR